MEISYEIPNLINQKILEHVKIRTFFIYPPAKKIKKTAIFHGQMTESVFSDLSKSISHFLKR